MDEKELNEMIRQLDNLVEKMTSDLTRGKFHNQTVLTKKTHIADMYHLVSGLTFCVFVN